MYYLFGRSVSVAQGKEGHEGSEGVFVETISPGLHNLHQPGESMWLDENLTLMS